MRRLIAPVVAAAVGIGIGVIGMLAAARLEARQSPAGVSRLMEFPIRADGIPGPYDPKPQFMLPTKALAFIKDTRGNGCWLVAYGDTHKPIALAVAPEASCQ